jgi:hypothetical protein
MNIQVLDKKLRDAGLKIIGVKQKPTRVEWDGEPTQGEVVKANNIISKWENGSYKDDPTIEERVEAVENAILEIIIDL